MAISIRARHECECQVCQQQSDSTTLQYHRQINLLLSRLDEPLAHQAAGQPTLNLDTKKRELIGNFKNSE